MYSLGISCYYHDSAAAILEDGEVIAAVEEERFSREKFIANGTLMRFLLIMHLCNVFC